MKIKNFTETNFPKANLFDSVDSIRLELDKNSFVVAMDNDQFHGLVTTFDIFERSHQLVGDCVGKKPDLFEEDPLEHAMVLMEEPAHIVLPVFSKNRQFIGVLRRLSITKFFSTKQQDLENQLNELKVKLSTSQTSIENQNRLFELDSNTIHAQKNELLGQLSGEITHDLKNVFQGISLGLEMISMQDSEQEYQQYIDNTLNFVNYGNDLVKQILHFYNDTTQGTHTVFVHQVIEMILAMIKHIATPGILVSYHNKSDSPLSVLGNESQIKQVFMNLCTNAIQAMEDNKKGGNLKITVTKFNVSEQTEWTHLPAKSYFKFLISDTGSGISSNNLKHIFEPFFTTKKGKKGTGIGLAITKSIVQEHQGKIFVESTLDQGTTFTILLPEQPIDGITI